MFVLSIQECYPKTEIPLRRTQCEFTVSRVDSSSAGITVYMRMIYTIRLQGSVPVFDLYVFDLDGTLVDTRRDIATAVNHVLDLHARPVPNSPRSFHGLATAWMT